MRLGRSGLAAAAATDHRIKAVGTVSAIDMGRQLREGAEAQELASSFTAPGSALDTSELVSSILATDGAARLGLGASIGEVQLIPGAGHALHQHQPERFAALLADFMDDLSR